MAHVSTYLNFSGTTEAAFNFYKAAFGTEFLGGIMRMGDVPGSDVNPEHANLVMNVALPIMAGHILMGTDVNDEMGFQLVQGNNVSICLHPDSKEDADRLYAALAEGGNAAEPLETRFWGDYWGFLIDKFGIHWMINYSEQTYS